MSPEIKDLQTTKETARSENSDSYEKLRKRSTTIFALLSVIVISFVGAVIGLRIASAVRAQMIEAYALSTATQVSGTVNSFITLQDLEKPFRGEKYEEFLRRFNGAVAGTNVVKVKLWRTDGTVLFSNDREIVGKKFTGKEQLEEALTGKGSFEISSLAADENYREKSEFNKLLEFYYPVYLDKTDVSKVSAVYEVYLSVLPLERFVDRVMRDLAVGLTVLVLLLIAIAQIASRMLRRRNDRLAELSEMLERKADTDGLTGLHNHGHFQSYLEREVAVSKRYDRNLSLIIIDLDFFKSVNDRFGHQIGDQVLQKVAGVFDEILRNADYSARYGGEEFVAVLPETDAEGAIQVAERLRRAAEGLVVELTGVPEPPRVTISCGVADLPSCADSRESLIAAADSALLFAKQNGRNRVYYFREISRAEFQTGDLDKLVSRLQHASMPTIQALVAAVDSSDGLDHERTRDLESMAQQFGTKLRLQENTLQALTLAAQVHDVGKIVVPDRLLGKNEPLTEAEVEAIRSHPEAGAKIVESAAQMENLLATVLHHHENWDGSGHPNGLSGEEIPYLARILKIIDAYAAMISDASDRDALQPLEAERELRAQAGTEFDPQLVEVFIAGLGEKAASRSDEKGVLGGSPAPA